MVNEAKAESERQAKIAKQLSENSRQIYYDNNLKNDDRVIGIWDISIIANADDRVVNSPYMWQYRGNTDTYTYGCPFTRIILKKGGKMAFNGGGFDTYNYEYVGDNTYIATTNDRSYINRPTYQSKITLKYEENNDTLTIVNWTDYSGNVVSTERVSSIKEKTLDRSKAIGTVYRRIN